jgi:O-antigen ligase
VSKKTRSRHKTVEAAAAARNAATTGYRGAPGRADASGPRLALEWAAGILAGLMVLAVGTGYDGRVYALYFTPRVVFFFVFAAGFILVSTLLLAPGIRSLRLDWLDALAGGFVVWQVVSAVAAPTRNLAWFGTYNRTSGAFLWIVLGLIIVLGRRTLSGRRGTLPLLWTAAFLLSLNAVMASIQALGGTIPWGGVNLADGRMTGSTGNAVNMAGLCLLAAWLGGLALFQGAPTRRSRWAAAVGAVAGLLPIVLAVSRASYIGVAVAGVVLIITVLLRRRWKAGVWLVVVLALFAVGIFSYSTSSQRISGGLTGGGQAAQASGGAASDLSIGDQQRVEFWRVAMQGTKARPLTGYGPGAYAVAFREFVPAARLQEVPNMVVSDPHDLPLLLSSTEGIPGVLLGMGLLCAAVFLVGARVVRGLRRPLGEEAGSFVPAVAASAYGLAILAYLLVSPTDLVTVCPFILVLGATLGEPAAGARLSWEVPSFRREAVTGRAVTTGIAIVAVVFLVAASVMGARLWRADISSVNASRGYDQQQALDAAELFPWYPHYAQTAGSLIWRAAINNKASAAESARGEQLLISSLSYDPGQVLARADLARFYLTTTRPALAVAQVRQGLAFCPNSPTLQALYAYSSYVATKEAGDPALGTSIRESFAALPPTVADGWYWLNMALTAEGDASAAQVALEKANALAPSLTSDDYARRLQGGQ